MFTNEIAIYGDYGVMADRLKEIGLFERILDVYICGAVVGMIMWFYFLGFVLVIGIVFNAVVKEVGDIDLQRK